MVLVEAHLRFWEVHWQSWEDPNDWVVEPVVLLFGLHMPLLDSVHLAFLDTKILAAMDIGPPMDLVVAHTWMQRAEVQTWKAHTMHLGTSVAKTLTDGRIGTCSSAHQ